MGRVSLPFPEVPLPEGPFPEVTVPASSRAEVFLRYLDYFRSQLVSKLEELPAAVLPGTYLLIDEVRFGVEEVRQLYESAGYPLSRAIGTS